MKAITNAFGNPNLSAFQQMLPYGQGQGTLKADMSRLQLKPVSTPQTKKLDVTA